MDKATDSTFEHSELNLQKVKKKALLMYFKKQSPKHMGKL